MYCSQLEIFLKLVRGKTYHDLKQKNLNRIITASITCYSSTKPFGQHMENMRRHLVRVLKTLV